MSALGGTSRPVNPHEMERRHLRLIPKDALKHMHLQSKLGPEAKVQNLSCPYRVLFKVRGHNV